jgi:RecJ-like exonuclease
MGDRELLNSIRKISRMIEELDDPIAVLTHYDADGLSSGGAFTRLLAKLNKKFVIRGVPDLSDESLSEFFDINAYSYIILDLGSGDLEDIYRMWKNTKSDYLIVIDHHKIGSGIPNDDNLIFLNPELYGLDGGRIGCTAILSSLIGYFQEKDPYFLEIGIIGATGDMQINGELNDVNKYLVRKSMENKIISRERDFIFFVN